MCFIGVYYFLLTGKIVFSILFKSIEGDDLVVSTRDLRLL